MPEDHCCNTMKWAIENGFVDIKQVTPVDPTVTKYYFWRNYFEPAIDNFGIKIFPRSRVRMNYCPFCGKRFFYEQEALNES